MLERAQSAARLLSQGADRARDTLLLLVATELTRWRICPEKWRRIPTPVANRVLSDARLIFVRTETIRYAWRWIGKTLGSRYFVLDGDWDEERDPLEPHKTIEELFVRGIPYRATEQYAYMMKNMRAGWYGGSYWCKTPEEIDAYFERLVKAYADIHDHGYKTQKELGLPGEDEILVVINREGDLMLGPGGTHRLDIARRLGIDVLPVLVYGVHYLWVRDRLREHGGDILGAIRQSLRRLDCRAGMKPHSPMP